MEDAEVNWTEYFLSIRKVCPWSYASWHKGLIEVQPWEGTSKELGRLDARLYVLPDRKFRILKKIAKRMNDKFPDQEWLWSHPRFGNYSTQVPVLIQQDRAKLETARRKHSF